MSKFVKINDTGFNRMINQISRGTNASLKDVTRIVTGSILQKAASNTGKSSTKKVTESVDRTLGRVFTSSSGIKIRKGKDGSLIIKSANATNNKWVRARNVYSINAISPKKPSGASFSKKQTSLINKGLSEMRNRRKEMLKRKKPNIASGQASFIYMIRKLRIKLSGNKGLGAALKVKLPFGHIKALDAREFNTGKDKYTILLKSTSKSALNPKAKGLDGFRKAFNSQVKGFEIAAGKNMKAYAKKFATKNGFTVR